MVTVLLSNPTAKTKISLSLCLSKAALDALCCQVSALLQAASSTANSLSAVCCVHVFVWHPGTAAMGLSRVEISLVQTPGRGELQPTCDAVLTQAGEVKAPAHRPNTRK